MASSWQSITTIHHATGRKRTNIQYYCTEREGRQREGEEENKRAEERPLGVHRGEETEIGTRVASGWQPVATIRLATGDLIELLAVVSGGLMNMDRWTIPEDDSGRCGCRTGGSGSGRAESARRSCSSMWLTLHYR